MSAIWIYVFILFSGVLQACGAPMNGQLRNSLLNPWLASLVSFGLIVLFLIGAFTIWPRPLPTLDGIANMPWWATLGGLIGAVAVFAGLMLVDRVGAGPYTGLTVTASLIMSIAIDHYGLFRMPTHSVNIWRVLGAVLMIGGVTLISRF
jgi:transporter family-2 protein